MDAARADNRVPEAGVCRAVLRRGEAGGLLPASYQSSELVNFVKDQAPELVKAYRSLRGWYFVAKELESEESHIRARGHF